MIDYQTLHLCYPVLVLVILSFILICFYVFLYIINRKGLFLLHFGFLALVTLENIAENLFQPGQTIPPNVRESTGYIISAFLPYYIYKLTALPAYRHYILHGLIILIPTVFFFFIFCPFGGSFLLARQLVYIVPACYGLYSIPMFFRGIKRTYSIQGNKLLYHEYIFLIVSIIFWSMSPILRIYLNVNRSITGLEGTTLIILFNVYIIVKELKLLVTSKIAVLPPAPVVKVSLSDYGLTPREIEVAELAYQGKTYKYIGKQLFISEIRVKQIISNIYKKIGVESKIEMIKKLKTEEVQAIN